MKKNELYICRRDIVIIVTHKCNLRCKYCYYKKSPKDNYVESPNMAYIKEKLIEEFEDCEKPVRITFHGGEPFINWPFMKNLAEWVWSVRQDVEFVVTTNGTMLDDDIKRWLKIHKLKFTVVLSIDGPKEVHDLERMNSFDCIDRMFFKEIYPTVGVKMTVTPRTLPYMYSSFCYLSEEGFYVNPSLAREETWDLQKDINLYETELNKIANWYLTHPEIPPAELLGINFSAQVNQFSNKVPCACGAGRGIIAYDIDGQAYPCHSFVDFRKRISKEQLLRLFELLRTNDASVLDSPCVKCRFAPWCSPCYGLSFVNRGSMGCLDSKMCRFSEITIPIAAKLQGKMLVSGRRYLFMQRFSEREKCLIAQSICSILKVKNNY